MKGNLSNIVNWGSWDFLFLKHTKKNPTKLQKLKIKTKLTNHFKKIYNNNSKPKVS